MSAHAWGVALLLGAAVLLTLLCAVGVLIMDTPYQRLHYLAPPAILGGALITAAVFLDEEQKQAGFKALLVTMVLIALNAVVSHATARAARIRERGSMAVKPEERP